MFFLLLDAFYLFDAWRYIPYRWKHYFLRRLMCFSSKKRGMSRSWPASFTTRYSTWQLFLSSQQCDHRLDIRSVKMTTILIREAWRTIILRREACLQLLAKRRLEVQSPEDLLLARTLLRLRHASFLLILFLCESPKKKLEKRIFKYTLSDFYQLLLYIGLQPWDFRQLTPQLNIYVNAFLGATHVASPTPWVVDSQNTQIL